MVSFPAKGKQRRSHPNLSPRAQASVIYHSIFDYPLTEGELIKWEVGKRVVVNKKIGTKITFGNNYYFISGNEGQVTRRLLRERNYIKKMEIARKAGTILNIIPAVSGVFISGALAMNNAKEKSDVDLLVVTKRGQLWTARAMTLLLFRLLGFPVRKYGEKDERNKLCFNLWLDEGALSWPKERRSLFSAHEIAQTKPIVNKDKIYERFLYSNRWLKSYWPNSVRIVKPPFRRQRKITNLLFFIEALARQSQYLYMKRKRTIETVSKNRAIFHPIDLEPVVLKKFKKGLTGLDK